MSERLTPKREAEIAADRAILAAAPKDSDEWNDEVWAAWWRQAERIHGDGFDQSETPEQRQARWESAALAAGREVDRNALRVYMGIADTEQRRLASEWAKSVASTDAEIRRLRARLAEHERPSTEAERNALRQSFTALISQAEEDHDHEGAFALTCQLREREEQWAREDQEAAR